MERRFGIGKAVNFVGRAGFGQRDTKRHFCRDIFRAGRESADTAATVGKPVAAFICGEGRRIGIDREAINWEAVRAEYMAGGVGQKALAEKYGVSSYALRKRAQAEGWAAARGGRKSGQDEDGDLFRARQTRRALLSMLERTARTMPCDATEVKTTGEDGAVKMLKLRDLTAAYKELVGDLPTESGGEGSRVIIDI